MPPPSTTWSPGCAELMVSAIDGPVVGETVKVRCAFAPPSGTQRSANSRRTRPLRMCCHRIDGAHGRTDPAIANDRCVVELDEPSWLVCVDDPRVAHFAPGKAGDVF